VLEHAAQAPVELAADEAEHALELGAGEADPVAQTLARALEHVHAGARDPARDRGAVRTVEDAELVDVELIEEVLAQQVALAAVERVERGCERGTKLRAVVAAEVHELGAGVGGGEAKEIVVVERDLALGVVQPLQGGPHGDGAQPAAQAAAALVGRDQRGPVGRRDEQLDPEHLLDVVEQAPADVHAAHGDRDVRKEARFERGDRVRVTAGARARDVEVRDVHVREHGTGGGFGQARREIGQELRGGLGELGPRGLGGRERARELGLEIRRGGERRAVRVVGVREEQCRQRTHDGSMLPSSAVGVHTAGAIDSECISDDAAAAFVEGTLVSASRELVEQHVDRCTTCRLLLSQLARVVHREWSAAAGAAASRGPVLEAGTSIGRYVIVRVLGAGGMGTVYAAFDPDLARDVAVKLLHVADGVDQKRVLHEARTMARITHPNVIAAHDVGIAEGRAFVAMELVDGTTLRQWLHAQPRTPGEIVAVFVQAGRGLAAAHRAGVVHRDFKPENVLCARDGRVCVTDFGLARDAYAHAYDASVAGTPAYMAPEQLAGAGTSAESDQFSFCVALYEALHGERPAAGAPRRTLRAVDRVLARGLAVAPGERHPSMDRLLAALAPAPRRGGLAVAAALVAAFVAAFVVAAFAIATTREHAEICGGAGDRLAGVWDPAQKLVAVAAFANTRTAFSADSWRGAADLLDRYTREWAVMHTDACRATRVRGEQTEEVLALRMACLDRKLAEVSALAAALQVADRATVVNAVPAAASLSRLAECADTGALLAAPRPAIEPALRARAAWLDGELATAKTQIELGHYPDALAALPPLRAAALAIGDRARAATCSIALGQTLSATGAYKRAEQALYEAISDAEHAGAEPIKVEAWSELAWIVGYQEAQHEQGMRFVELAAAVLDRIGGNLDERGELLARRAAIDGASDKPEQARDELAQARQVLEKLHGPDAYQLGLLDSSAAAAQFDLGHYDQAVALEQRAIRILEHALGRLHPMLGDAFITAGFADMQVDRVADAKVAYGRALEIAERSLPPEHPQRADAYQGLALPLLAEGDGAGAQRLFERALAIRERVLGPGHPDLAIALVGIAQALDLQDEPAAALPVARRALAIYERVDDGRTTDVATTLDLIGGLEIGASDLVAARAALERANALQDRLLEPDHPDRIDTLGSLAKLELREGRYERARMLAARAVAIATAKHLPPGDSAAPSFELAQALWALDRDRPHARALASSARDACAGHAKQQHALLAEIAAWLERHPSYSPEPAEPDPSPSVPSESSAPTSSNKR